MHPTRRYRVPSNSRPSNKAESSSTTTPRERLTRNVGTSEVPPANPPIPYAGEEIIVTKNFAYQQAEFLKAHTKPRTKPNEEVVKAIASVLMEKLVGPPTTAELNARVPPVYDPSVIDAATIANAHARYNIAMARLFSRDPSAAVKPSFRAIVWPIYGPVTHIEDLSIPAITHFLANSSKFRDQFPDEDDENYANILRQHVAARASEEIHLWESESFGRFVVDRIENKTERMVVKVWQSRLLQQLTKIVLEMMEGASEDYTRAIFEQFVRTTEK